MSIRPARTPNPQPPTPNTYVFAHDGHGSVRALLDAVGAIATIADHPAASAIRQLFTYDAYGNALGFNMSAAATVLLYSGEQFDQRVEMQSLRARFYDAANGRFVGLDPYSGNSSDPQSFHKYLYTHGNPIAGIDPTGLFEILSLGITMNASFQSRLQSSASGLKIYKDVSQTIRAFSKAVRGVQAAWDWVNAVRDAIDMFSFDPSDLLDLGQLLPDLALNFATINTTIHLKVPAGIERKIRKILGNRWSPERSPYLMEWMGTIATAVVGKALGLQSSDIKQTKNTGIDGLMKFSSAFTGTRFVVVEAKGGQSSGLDGNQMKDDWIRSRLDKMLRDNPGAQDRTQLQTALQTHQKMLAVVVKAKTLFDWYIGIQGFPGVRQWDQQLQKPAMYRGLEH